MQNNVLQLKFINETEKKISASLFQLFSDNTGLTCGSAYCNVNSEYFTNLKLWLLKNKFNCNLMRLQFNIDNNDCQKNHFYFRNFSYITGNPFGSSTKYPLFIVGENLSPKQYQTNMIDVPLDVEFDGYSTDVLFDIYPKESFSLTLFEKVSEEQLKKYNERLNEMGRLGMIESDNKLEKVDKGLTPFQGFPIIIENNSDESLTVDLFSRDDYDKLVQEKRGFVYPLYLGRGNFGSTSRYVSSKEVEEEYSYINHIKSLKRPNSYKYFDCIRIVNPNQHELNDIVVNGRIIKTKGYVNDEDFCKIAVDVMLEGKNEFDSCIITVPPKTNMMFSFGKYSEIILFKPKHLISNY